jgi:hypothetical protein
VKNSKQLTSEELLEKEMLVYRDTNETNKEELIEAPKIK